MPGFWAHFGLAEDPIEIVEGMPSQGNLDAEVRRYLQTKKAKLGHFLDLAAD